MVEIGYALSSEEHGPRELVEYARRAEEVGFSFALISDHYFPWLDSQGNSPFAWTVIGAIAQATDRLYLGTGVTCPILRYHPAIIAQAAATAAVLMPGRFFLGVGTGEHLNEHILGEHWPPIDVRRQMLHEAIEVIRLLWSGDLESYYGDYFTVEDARVYTRPDQPPPILVAAAGSESAELAGTTGDGFISVAPDAGLVRAFESAGGQGKPRYGQLTVCWAQDETTAKRVAHQWWRQSAVPGQLSQELRLPQYFEEASELVTEEMLCRSVVCGPDPQRHLAAIKKFADAGYDHVYIHQVGPDQEGFFRFYEREVLPGWF